MLHHNSLLRIAGLVLSLLCAPGISFGCAQVHGTSLDGLPFASSSSSAQRIFLAIKADPAGQAPGISSLQTNTAREKRENEAVALMFSGTPQEAARILLEMEKESPGEYTIAANLGTAYELAGDASNAHFWITEGIRRNANSHGGTEWLHRLILETKIRLQKDPRYLATHRIIPLPESFNKSTVVDVGGKKEAIGHIQAALTYQLQERCVFVKPVDPIVADLLFSYARIEGHTGTVEQGLKFLKASKEYGFADPKLLEQTETRYKASARIGRIYMTLALILVVVGAPAGLYVAYRKKWFFLTSAAHQRHLAEKKRAAEMEASISKTG